MELFLTSEGREVLDELVAFLPPSAYRTIGYVPTAGGPEVPDWMEEEIVAIEGAGFAVRRVDLAELSSEDLPAAFEGVDAFWVGGGNTFLLLREVRRSGFDAFVTERIEAGMPYVGTSAGSLLLAPNIACIRAAEDPDGEFDLDSYDGLGLFPLVPFPHMNNPDFHEVYRQILMDAHDDGVRFVTLWDGEFIHVQDDRWRIVSTG
ncbi:MAG: type 1 glutamine amidotransferase-like domain-containing protein [Acidimicrobiia bacterium]|nr:type 1 glutamine amidotransferase-like domain-containing protein [Acidimicrobiia bacterium]